MNVVPLRRILRAFFDDFICNLGYAFFVFLPCFFRALQFGAIVFVECRVDIPFVALNVFDLNTGKHHFFDLVAMRTYIPFIFSECGEMVSVFSAFRVLGTEFHHLIDKPGIEFRIFRREQAFRLDNVAHPFRKVIPRNGKTKFGIADCIVFTEIHAVCIIPCMVFARSFHSRPVFVSQKLGKVLDFGRLGIFVQNALLSGRLFADDCQLDDLSLLSLLFRAKFFLPVLLGAVFDISCLFLFGKVVIVVDEVCDPHCYFRPFQKSLDKRFSVFIAVGEPYAFAVVLLVVAAPSAATADAIFPFEKVCKCFRRWVFIVLIENTVFAVLKPAAVFQAPLDKKLLFRLLLRFHKIEKRHLGFFSRSVFDTFLFFLSCGFRLILGFFRFGFFLEILLVLKAIVLFLVVLFFLFVIKRSRLVVNRDKFQIFYLFLFFRKQFLQFSNLILVTLDDFRQ